MINRHGSLWRVDGDPLRTPADPLRLQAGLHLHLEHAPLTMVWMQIGTTRRSYLGMTGCAGCVHARCGPGCHGELLRRLLQQIAPDLALSVVRGGLATRPYTRVVLATPGRAAQPLTAALLADWGEARLTLGWRGDRTHRHVGALLAVGDGGPAPGAALRERGWHPWPVPLPIARPWLRAALPSVPLGAGAGNLHPMLTGAERPRSITAVTPIPCDTPGQPRRGWRIIWGQRVRPAALDPADMVAVKPWDPQGVHDEQEDGSRPQRPTCDPALDEPLASWLTSLLEHPHQPAEDAPTPPPAEAPSPWPAGPGDLTPAALGALVAQLLAEPRFQSTRKGQSGLSKGRLAGLSHAGLSELTARALMVWFDQAGVLAPPEDGQRPWRAPRPFALTDLDQIAAKLRATPLPTSAAIAAAYGGAA